MTHWREDISIPLNRAERKVLAHITEHGGIGGETEAAEVAGISVSYAGGVLAKLARRGLIAKAGWQLTGDGEAMARENDAEEQPLGDDEFQAWNDEPGHW